MEKIVSLPNIQSSSSRLKSDITIDRKIGNTLQIFESTGKN
jgi:hypothetical protein